MTTTTDSERQRLAPPPPPAVPQRSLAGWCARHRWTTLLAALIVVAAAVVLLGGGLRTTTGADQLVGDSKEASKLLEGADFGDRPAEHLLVSVRRGTLTGEQVATLGTQIRDAYTGVEGVGSVGEPILSADGRTMLVSMELTAAKDDDTAIEDTARRMMPVTDGLVAAHPDLEVGQTGEGSLNAGVGEQIESDLRKAEIFSLPVTLVILLLAFGSVVAAFVPVLLGIAAVGTALGVTALISQHYAVDQNTQSLVLLIGLAVGVDYALFVIRRARQERAHGLAVRDTIRVAGATAGRAVIISGITVVVSMTGMLIAGGLYTSLAIGAVIVVAVAVAASATVLPAVQSLLGDGIDRLRLPFIGRRVGREASVDGPWGRLAGAVVRRPLIWTLAATALLVALAVPAAGMRTALFGVESLPQDLPQVKATMAMTGAFPQEGSNIELVVGAPAGSAAQVRTALEQAWPVARGTGVVVGDEASIRVSKDGAVNVMSLAIPYESSDGRAGDAVEKVRDQVVPAVRGSLDGVPGAAVHLGGVAEGTELSSWMDGRLLPVVAFVLVLTFVVMALSFGSLWLALATVLLNLLSVGAGYGVMTSIFQNTWAEGLLDFTSVGAIASWLPLLMFVILFGLSMDYHVFVVSRVREAWRDGHSPKDAVRLGVARSAGTVTSAAAVMVAVFAIFATMSVLEMKQLGVGLATAVFIDATVVRGVLLPAVLAVLGEKAHRRPRWLPALHD
ncbi:MMPL family transporter [Kineosporia sp. J2-2]|uniref:MMPL family transporter n=1 Tax=Kineosporia corallincola TaxID=2835133 RepID=A0ABS5TLV9_9ACTN|nr:MMPL family transporter [Kineosporia corallincola]MBT0772083.1 MMPL family transporter [Kineosporia corallincola]